ncbi:hypothetical protein CA13_15580 [Planctomycetes bacterium CA13]|uniref:Uncharacterized protein n=1 Tax=Novipirellula herctigrandis TaxID=2527986 RepID=A0A5C5YYH7_9BACT|nr:hypothetical protein CA13_15580 [Planctomycetes bacterium CA13]
MGAMPPTWTKSAPSEGGAVVGENHPLFPGRGNFILLPTENGQLITPVKWALTTLLPAI